MPQGFPEIALPAFSVDLLGRAVQPAITLALLGSINTLLTSLMADSMTRTQHDSDRELIGQGVGNVATGFIAGMPSAGITVLTGANIRAGARTRVSAVLCAGILLAILLGLGRFLEVIPHAALAAILMTDQLGHHRLALPDPHETDPARAPRRDGRPPWR